MTNEYMFDQDLKSISTNGTGQTSKRASAAVNSANAQLLFSSLVLDFFVFLRLSGRANDNDQPL